ncbi:hypothetical protein [Streptomyces sp. V4I2]|nr:hypothetical protein [Streptomyces sp. V4I2]MDQ1051121.1 hypothetical protein [Streptomyces sp. V4I2]
MRHFAGLGNLAVWYARADMDALRKLADRKLGARGRERTRPSSTVRR